jgi:hypothetical protein
MKLIKQYINEKFEEESDPIKDMGIGLYTVRDFESMEKAIEFLISVLPNITKEHDLNKFLNKSLSGGAFINHKLWEAELWPYIQKYIHIEHLDFLKWVGKFGNIAQELRKAIEKKLGKNVNEKFVEDSDPVRDLGIGARHIREFETAEEAANFFLNNISIVSKFKSLAHLKKVMKHYDEPGAGPSILKEVKEFLDGWNYEYTRAYGAIHIKEWGEPFDKQRSKLQYLKDFRDLILDKLEKGYVNEKFSEEGDPIHDMGIGGFKAIIQQIFDIDRKNEFIPEAGAPGNVNYITMSHAPGRGRENVPGIHFKIHFFSNSFYDPKTHKKISKLNYAKQLLAEVDILDYFSRINGDYRYSFIIDCQIRQKYKDFFIPGTYYDKQKLIENLNEKFSEEGDPIKDMGIGIEVVYKNWVNKNFPRLSRSGLDDRLIFKAAVNRKAHHIIEYMLSSGKIDIHEDDEHYLRVKAYNERYYEMDTLLKHGANLDRAIQKAKEKDETVTLQNLLNYQNNMEKSDLIN